MRQLELSLLADPGQWDGHVISQEPYVKILGSVGWSAMDRSYIAAAQVESTLCVVAVNLTEVS